MHLSRIAKAVTPVLTAVVLLAAVVIFINSEHRSQVELQDHTQTLTEIQHAVTELKSSNVADHQQTVKYINCVLVGITEATPGNQAGVLSVYQECLANAGIDSVK